jgi:hypothetical protein
MLRVVLQLLPPIIPRTGSVRHWIPFLGHPRASSTDITAENGNYCHICRIRNHTKLFKPVSTAVQKSSLTSDICVSADEFKTSLNASVFIASHLPNKSLL